MIAIKPTVQPLPPAIPAALLLLSACSPPPEAPPPWDRDGDGAPEDVDCDDRDPLRWPGAPELCDGVDQDCSGDAEDERDADGDGARACEDCDDGRADVFPGAPPACDGGDTDCDGVLSEAEAAAPGDDPLCPVLDCAAAGGRDGAWIDGGGSVPAWVACDGPWIVLSLDSSDRLVVASRAPDNGFGKCEDDGTSPWPWVSEAELEDDFPADRAATWIADLAYESDGVSLPWDTLLALSAHVRELHPDDRLVAVTADDDGGTWQDGGARGLEAYAVGADGSWSLLTPGRGPDCGGATPLPGGQSSFYRWSTEAQGSQVGGEVAFKGPLGALPPQAALPLRFALAIYSGGGVAVGWSDTSFRVR